MEQSIALERKFCADNYAPLPVVLHSGAGAWLTDIHGKRYLDLMSAYSATSFGHGHPRLLAALTAQAQTLAMVSRAYYSDRLGPFLQRLCLMTRMDRALPMNTGAEAVETALKAARKWAYEIKDVAPDRAQIIVCAWATIVGFSSEQQYRAGFGPFAPGFVTVPYGDAASLEAAITPDTAAFLVEPIQGEAGIIVPPDGYLAQCRAICSRHDVLLICDEVQTGLGRTGRLLACDHDGVHPDGLVLGKALGGGLLPVSAFLARDDVMAVFRPGDHGSTFGGNPLACAVGLAALDLLEEEDLAQRAEAQGAMLMERLRALQHPAIREIRGRGLLIGMEVDPAHISARDFCERLMARGILSKDTHGTVVRIAPPLIIGDEEVGIAVAAFADVLQDIGTAT
jgi:ornithine--oxo-acid transaminase